MLPWLAAFWWRWMLLGIQFFLCSFFPLFFVFLWRICQIPQLPTGILRAILTFPIHVVFLYLLHLNHQMLNIISPTHPFLIVPTKCSNPNPNTNFRRCQGLIGQGRANETICDYSIYVKSMGGHNNEQMGLYITQRSNEQWEKKRKVDQR